MTEQEHGWVTCAPGDPNDAQLSFVHKMAGDRPFCMRLWNADTGAIRVNFDDKFIGEHEVDVDTDGRGWSPLHGKYLPIDLTANNNPRNPEHVAHDFGWGVCRQGYGLQDFGDGYMCERVARARAEALNTGCSATTIPNIETREEYDAYATRHADATYKRLGMSRDDIPF
jgi:hypothetical protein